MLPLCAGRALSPPTSPAPARRSISILSKWSAAYQKATGNGLNYQSIGSGAGIKQIEAGTVIFGASDQPLKSDVLEKNGLTQFPFIMGEIVPVVNVKESKAGELVLDGPTLAAIYLGKITKWNDPAIVKLDPDVKLPGLAITVVERSDGSGTTFNFADYLSKVSDDWKTQVGENTALQWPAGIGAKGNEGVAGSIMQTDGAIGYVEYAYAKQNNLSYADMINKDGKKVAPTMATFQAAAANADWSNAPDSPNPDLSTGRSILADHRFDLWFDAHSAQGCRRFEVGHRLFRLGVQEWPKGCGKPRLHSHAEKRRRFDQEGFLVEDLGEIT